MKTKIDWLLGPIIFTVIPSVIVVCAVVCLIVAISERSSVALLLYLLMLASSIIVRKQVSNCNFCLIFVCSSSCIYHPPTTAIWTSQE